MIPRYKVKDSVINQSKSIVKVYDTSSLAMSLV